LGGRFLGGRPPYGYRLAGAGPHPNPNPNPNPSKAAEGKRLHKLEPDPVTAPIVERIFTEYVAGRGMTSIASGLTRDGIACPSAYDRARNPHRHTQVWETTAVRAILQNPRYTGRQVWNRARTDEVLIDVEDVALGHENRHRWNDPSQWAWSRTESHTPLISTDLYERAQHTVKTRGTSGDTGKAPRRSRYPYLFRGLLRCGLCDRIMAGSVNHGRIYYRCKASRDDVRQHGIAHPPVLYLRQESIIDPVDRFLTEELGRTSLADTLHRIADASHRAALAEHQQHDDAPRLRKTIAESDNKIAQYRATLDAGGDPTLVAGWISETMAVRKAAQALLGLAEAPPERMSEEQLAAIVDAFGGLLGLLRRAEQHDRAEIYTRIGLQMTYRPGTETVLAEVRSKDIDRVPVMCPEGDVNTQKKHPRLCAVFMRP
jgi:site-specific DNA recombinase